MKPRALARGVFIPDIVITMIGVNDWVGTVPYENGFMTRIKFFTGELKVFKLIRIYWLHIINKIGELALSYSSGKNLQSGRAYVNLGYFCINQGKYSEADQAHKKALKLNPDNASVYDDLGALCVNQGRYSEAEVFFKKTLELNPNNPAAYKGLGECLRIAGRTEETIEKAKKAIELAPGYEDGYVLLGNCYLEQGRFRESEMMFKKALEINPTFEPTYTELGRCYRAQREFEGIKELAQEIIKNKVDNDRLYGFVATSYREEGKCQKAEEYYKKANAFRLKYYNPATRHNYQKLKESVMQRGIKLVCIQYPLRSIEPLKKLFDSTEGIIFVENKKIFEDALKAGKYEDYFEDSFGGEFGHGTAEGNRLLAENVANTILKEAFKK